MAMNRLLRSGTPAWVAPTYVAGLALVYLGERVFSTIGWLRAALTGLGAAAIVALTLVRWAAAGTTSDEQRKVERSLALLSTGGAFAVVLYFTTTGTVLHLVGMDTASAATRHRYESSATVAWIAIVLGTVLPMLFAETALLPMRRAMRVEWRRVREAMAAGLVLAMAAAYGALFTFVAGELDVKADFSYFHTASPSESTRKVASSTTDGVDVRAFFPETNAVGADVGAYLRDLARSSPTIHVETHDRLLVPELAKAEKVTEDGVVVVDHGTERDTLTIGTDINVARPKLKSLDADFQKALLKVLRPRRFAYFTVGHGEITDALAPPLPGAYREGTPPGRRAAKLYSA